ncbi:MAG TPA: hypothetical protein PKK26_06985 [Candidatus Wallbacteria bacterium]|nr:hypothetical protein [Candidatus Wallbacteria bacterium]
MVPVYLLILAIAIGIFQKVYRGKCFVTAFLLSLIVLTVGFTGIWAFMGHYFKADMVAQGIGWPAGNPFQKEVAFTNLGIGVLGILCIWFRGNFWLATIIMNSVFLLGAASIHIKDIIEKGNMNIYNAGPVLYADILGPLILIGLFIAKQYTDPEPK